MVALLAAALLLVPAQSPGQDKGKKKNAPAKEIENIDPIGRFEGGIIDQSASYFIWFDDGEWRLRTGSTNRKTTFSGTIKVKNGAFASWHGAGLDNKKKTKNPDLFQVSNDRTQITFQFITAGRADGLNFKVKGDDPILEFDLRSDAAKQKRVKIGKEKESPSGMPFRLRGQPVESEKSKKASRKESAP